MLRTVILTAFATMTAVTASAQEVEETASEEEVASISEALAMFNCEVTEEVEKESDNLFELDDAVCEAGQYDIKLDAGFTVTSMTYDGPVDN